MKTTRILLTVVSLLVCIGTQAQTLEQLRANKERAQKQLEATNALLGKNRDNINLSERQRKLVLNNMATRRNMISTLDKEAAAITSEINTNTRQIRELDQQLENLKQEYGEFIYSAWKNHKMNTAVAFLFASRDFNDATKRVSHMKRYNEMRVKKGAEIDSLNYILQYEIEKLNLQKAELEESKKQKNSELQSLGKEEKQIAATLNSQKSEGKKLDAQAKELQRQISNAQKQIDKIIAEQAKAGKAARTQEDIILSGKFEDNKGKLPWPAGSPGSVLDRFGKHAVSGQKGITNDYKGITIAAQRGASVKAVFEGEVSGVYNLDHFNHCVMVRSGSYIVLYGNLGRTSVKKGDKISLNQEIGRLYDTDNEDQHMLIFQIWRETTPVDPQAWLRP